MNFQNQNSKIIKDTKIGDTQLSSIRQSFLSYTKTNKLITALYMVTDIIDKDEPARLRLRTLGTDILSDVVYLSTNSVKYDLTDKKIQEVLFLLNMVCDLNLVSQMNVSILQKEFLVLKKAINDFRSESNLFGGKSTLNDFLIELNETENNLNSLTEESLQNVNKLDDQELNQKYNLTKDKSPLVMKTNSYKGQINSIGHLKSTRIGVQKGSTFLKALSDKMSLISNDLNVVDLLKQKRQSEILKIIKENKESIIKTKNLSFDDLKNIDESIFGTSITDIKNKATDSLKSCSEKTLQRELVAMVKDGVLKKSGTKRWSRYFL